MLERIRAVSRDSGQLARARSARFDKHRNRLAVPVVRRSMHRATELEREIEELRGFGGRRVHLRLRDGSQHAGTLRTDLLSPRSISVFLASDDGEGATIYIDEIIAICPIS